MNTILKKIIFEIKMRWVDWKYYTFDPLSRGAIYPPSFYLRYTPEEQARIQMEQLEELTEMLRKYDEENGIIYPKDKNK